MLRAGRYAEAALGAERVLESDPVYDRAHATLGWAYFRQGKQAQGVAELERAVSLSHANSQWLAQLGQAYGLVGRTDKAREILQQLEDRARETYISPYHLAFVYVGLGELDRAIDLLERAFEARTGAVYSLKGSMLLAPLRTHPRFQALLKRIKLT